ncbi:hypothetical protein KFD70_17580 [Bacillus pfraonensis]
MQNRNTPDQLATIALYLISFSRSSSFIQGAEFLSLVKKPFMYHTDKINYPIHNL